LGKSRRSARVGLAGTLTEKLGLAALFQGSWKSQCGQLHCRTGNGAPGQLLGKLSPDSKSTHLGCGVWAAGSGGEEVRAEQAGPSQEGALQLVAKGNEGTAVPLWLHETLES
jgi:hypothetical protein